MLGIKTEREKAEAAIEKLSDRIYETVARRLADETEKRMKTINEQLQNRLENWDIMLDKHVKDKVNEEWKAKNGQSNN